MKSEEKDNLFKEIDNTVIEVMNNEPYLFGKTKSVVTIELLHGKDRHKEVVVSRQICTYLADFIFNSMLRENVILEKIGKQYGQKHSNIIHSKSTILNYLDTESQIMHIVAACMDSIYEYIRLEKYRTPIKEKV